MLKNISSLKGAQKLSKKEQQSINGGYAYCKPGCVGKNVGDKCHATSNDCRQHQDACGYELGVFKCISL